MLRGADLLANVDPALSKFAYEVGELFDARVTSGLRTNTEQSALYAQGRTMPGRIVTNARDATESAHGRGAAIDIVPLDANGHCVWSSADPRWDIIGKLAERSGLVWGGHFKSLCDKAHVELQNWRSLSTPAQPKE